MPYAVTSKPQTKSDDLTDSYQDEEVLEFLVLEPATALALEEAMPIIRDVFGEQVKPLLLVAHDPDGSQYSRLMALIPVRGEIELALSLLSSFRQKLFDTGTLSNNKLCIDVEII